MTDRVRIVHLTTVHHPLDPRIYLKQARSLASAGYEVWLLARGEGFDELDDVRFVPLPNGRSRFARLRRQVAARREIRHIRPEVIHIHDPELLPLARWLKRSLGAKVIYDKHEDYGSRGGLEGKVVSSLENWAFGWVDHVILAEDLYRAAVEGRSVPFSTVLNYAIAEPRAPRVNQAVIRNLVYTGTVSRGRGLFHMIELAVQIKRRQLDMKIRVVGICNYPAERKSAEQVVADKQLGDVITFEGWSEYAPSALVRQACLQADAGLMLADPDPNYVVSIPSKFYEYIQYGLPIIASDIPLWKDFLDRTGCGITMEPSDEDGIETILQLGYPEGRLEALAGTMEQIAAEFEWTRAEPILLAAYAGLDLGKTGRS